MHAKCHFSYLLLELTRDQRTPPRCLLFGVVYLVRLISPLFRLSLRVGSSGTTSTTALPSSFRRSRAISGRGTLAGRTAGEGRSTPGVQRLEAAKPGENKVRASTQYLRVKAMLYTAASTLGGGSVCSGTKVVVGVIACPATYLGYFTNANVSVVVKAIALPPSLFVVRRTRLALSRGIFLSPC